MATRNLAESNKRLVIITDHFQTKYMIDVSTSAHVHTNMAESSKDQHLTTWPMIVHKPLYTTENLKLYNMVLIPSQYLVHFCQILHIPGYMALTFNIQATSYHSEWLPWLQYTCGQSNIAANICPVWLLSSSIA